MIYRQSQPVYEVHYYHVPLISSLLEPMANRSGLLRPFQQTNEMKIIKFGEKTLIEEDWMKEKA